MKDNCRMTKYAYMHNHVITFCDHLDKSFVSPVTSPNEPHIWLGVRTPWPPREGPISFFWGDIRGHAPVPCTQHYSPDGSMRFPVAVFGWGLGPPASGPPQGGSFFLLTADGFRGRVKPAMLGERPSFLFRVRARPDGPKHKAQTAESGGRFIIFYT